MCLYNSAGSMITLPLMGASRFDSRIPYICLSLARKEQGLYQHLTCIYKIKVILMGTRFI